MTSIEGVSNLIFELREHRIGQIVEDIQTWADRPIEFSRDPTGSDLYSIEETKRTYCRRFLDLSETAHQLLTEDKHVAAATLSRSAIETVAMSVFFVHEISRQIRTKNLSNFQARVRRFLVGSSTDNASEKPIHISDALRHLQALDEAEIRHLWNKYPEYHKLTLRAFLPHKNDIRAEGFIAAASVMKNYDFLSDFAHPNGPGTFFIYPQPENEGLEQTLVRDRLANLAKSATWHGRHMLEALNASVDQADEYFRAFGATGD